MKVFKSLGQDPINVTVPIPGTDQNRTVETYPAFVAYPGFQAYYFDNANMHKECAVMAINSFCLTVVNILCIIIAGTLLLKIKEIAPESSMPRTQRFWKHDIKVARDYNRTLHESNDLGQEFLQEWAKVSGVDPKLMSSNDPQSRLAQLQTLQDILMDAEDDEVYQTVTRHLANQPASLARRLTMHTLPGGGLQPCADPADPESGLRWRRNSQLVSNMLHNFERRSSKNLGVYAYDNPSPVRDALSPPSSVTPAQPHALSRRRSSVQRTSYWPTRFSVSPVAEPRRRVSRASVRPAILREEDDETSRI